MGWARVKWGLRVLGVSEPNPQQRQDQMGSAEPGPIATLETKSNLHLTPDENTDRPDSIL